MINLFKKEEDPQKYVRYLMQGIENAKGKALGFMKVGLRSHLRRQFPGLKEGEADAIIKEFAGDAEVIN